MSRKLPAQKASVGDLLQAGEKKFPLLSFLRKAVEVAVLRDMQQNL